MDIRSPVEGISRLQNVGELFVRNDIDRKRNKYNLLFFFMTIF